MLTADILEGWIGPERRLPASLARNYLLSTAIPASPEFPQCRLNQFILLAPGFSPHQQPQYPYPARTNRHAGHLAPNYISNKQPRRRTAALNFLHPP